MLADAQQTRSGLGHRIRCPPSPFATHSPFLDERKSNETAPPNVVVRSVDQVVTVSAGLYPMVLCPHPLHRGARKQIDPPKSRNIDSSWLACPKMYPHT